jgi:hypothetical protein
MQDVDPERSVIGLPIEGVDAGDLRVRKYKREVGGNCAGEIQNQYRLLDV